VPELPPDATRQQKMAYYADVSRGMHRPWTTNVGMSRDAQPVPIITHGVTTDEIAHILNYTVKGRASHPFGADGFVRAEEAMQLVVDHLGGLGIDTALLPPPYAFFALTKDEATVVLESLAGFAASVGDGAVDQGIVAEAPPDPRTVVQEGQAHSWVQANDYFEAVMRRLSFHVTKGDVLALLRQATQKEFYELTPDELFQHAADLDRLGKQPGILKQAIDQLRVRTGS
jgi:hypothetical protein